MFGLCCSLSYCAFSNENVGFLCYKKQLSGVFPEFTDDLQGFKAMKKKLPTYLLQVQSSISDSEKTSLVNSRI